jgi:hypothetical protein
VIEAAQARPEVLVQVGLEYRYIPAVAKLIEQVKLNSVGRVRMVSIREHRFPFLVKVQPHYILFETLELLLKSAVLGGSIKVLSIWMKAKIHRL